MLNGIVPFGCSIGIVPPKAGWWTGTCSQVGYVVTVFINIVFGSGWLYDQEGCCIAPAKAS